MMAGDAVERPGRLTPVRVGVCAVVAGGVFALAHLVDGWAHANVVVDRIIEKDWAWSLRVLGYVPVWVVVALIMVREDRRRARLGTLPGHLRDMWSRGVILVSSAVLAGGLAEVGKLVTRRLRPPREGAWDGVYLFRTGDWTWSTGGIGLPSSHAAVAFGAGFALAALHPRYRWWCVLIGVGCAFQRVAQRAHFVSDTVLAAAIAAACVAVVWRAHWWLLRKGGGVEGATA